jgi:hypothetical protein
MQIPTPALPDEVAEAVTEFETAWSNPSNTTFELTDVDVNELLSHLAPRLRVTALVLWDVELRKAWDPQVYIPDVVRTGRSWDRRWLATGSEVFWRASEQRAWMTGALIPVIERACVNHRERRIVFLGRPKAVDNRGELLLASDEQPLFFVEHGVKGTEDAPLISWRMVHLTQRPDERLRERLHAQLGATSSGHSLPAYLRIYLQRDLGIETGRQ